MAQIHWINAAGGDFNTATTGVNDTVNIIQTIALTTLSIGGNSLFIASAGSGTGANAGTIAIGNNTGFEAGGTLKVSGTGFFQTTDTLSLFNGQTRAVTN